MAYLRLEARELLCVRRALDKRRHLSGDVLDDALGGSRTFVLWVTNTVSRSLERTWGQR